MYQMGECDDEVSNDSDASSTEQTSSEGSTWEESSESVSLFPPDEKEEGDLSKFLLDTFGSTDTTLDDLIEL